jgi:hypothetical protein
VPVADVVGEVVLGHGEDAAGVGDARAGRGIEIDEAAGGARVEPGKQASDPGVALRKTGRLIARSWVRRAVSVKLQA